MNFEQPFVEKLNTLELMRVPSSFRSFRPFKSYTSTFNTIDLQYIMPLMKPPVMKRSLHMPMNVDDDAHSQR
jgi:hypothetical protein